MDEEDERTAAQKLADPEQEWTHGYYPEKAARDAAEKIIKNKQAKEKRAAVKEKKKEDDLIQAKSLVGKVLGTLGNPLGMHTR